PDFREQLLAASLKPIAVLWLAVCARHFREQLLAASLKPERVLLLGVGGAEFPRAVARGLIEARCRCSRSRSNRYFREQLLAASLKPAMPVFNLNNYNYFREQLLAASLKLPPVIADKRL